MSIVMYYQKNFFLSSAIDEVIRRIQAAGLIEYWHKKFERKWKKVEVKGPKKFNFEHLSGVFYILVFGLMIALLIFFGEFVIGRMLKFHFYV